MKSIPSNVFQLENKNLNQINKNSTQKHLKTQNQYKLEFEISQDKPNSIDRRIKQSEINSISSKHKNNNSQNILSSNKNSIKPRKGDETPKSYISQFETINSKEEKLITNLFIKNQSENHKDYSLLNGLSINENLDKTKLDMLPISDINKQNCIPDKSKDELSSNYILKKESTEISSKKEPVSPFNTYTSASNLIYNLKNCKTTPVASASSNVMKMIISPKHCQADTNQINYDLNLNPEGNLTKNRSNTQRNYSDLSRQCVSSNDIVYNKSKRAHTNFNISTQNNYSITDRGTLIFDLEDECVEQPRYAPDKLFQNNPTTRLNSVNLNKSAKNKLIEHKIASRISSKEIPSYNKYNTQELVYDLVRQYSSTKISKKEDFMQRMMFDVFKRQTKEERINRIVERSKPRLDEDQRIEAFNRLIEDANRRIDASDRIEKMKIYSDTEPSMKKCASPEPTNWEDTYRKRFLEFKLEKEFLLEKKIIEKEKNIKVEEDKIVKSINKNTRKAAKSEIKKSCDRMYSVAENIEIKRKEKLKKLENLNKKYLEELCCLKLFKNNPMKRIETVIELDRKALNNTNTSQSKQNVNRRNIFMSSKEKKKLPTETFNFENYNYFIYNTESNENLEKNQNNKKLVKTNKELTKESAQHNYNFDSDNNIQTDSISKFKQEAKIMNIKHPDINMKRSINKSINKIKSVTNHVSIPDYLDSDNDTEYIETILPTSTNVASNSLLYKELKSPNLRTMACAPFNNRKTNIPRKYLPECMANQIVERILKDKI